MKGFNTQPPEGGCSTSKQPFQAVTKFQHTATRRWLLKIAPGFRVNIGFQHTATRRWLPGWWVSYFGSARCFNTQPPEGGCKTPVRVRTGVSCFNTQPPEGGCAWAVLPICALTSFNTQPPEGGCTTKAGGAPSKSWQPPEGGCPNPNRPHPRFGPNRGSHPKVAAQTFKCIR